MKSQRKTIFIQHAEITDHQAHAGDQFVLRVQAPKIAFHARAGSFAHICCDPRLPMRRPLSILRVDSHNGWLDFLYKVTGEGTLLLSQRKVGDLLDVMGPIGVPFRPHTSHPRSLLIGGGVGIPPMVFLADELRKQRDQFLPFVIMGSEIPFPFHTRPSTFIVPGMPDGVIAAMPLLEDWHIPSRLASLRGYTGCFPGVVTDLARHWLDALSEEQRKQVEVFACGPHPMLSAVALMTRDYHLPCQVSLEEFMACAVGGCAGCVVKIHTKQGTRMKRVCVDGPVFDADAVFPSP